jgi:hypothetical protein
MGRGAKPGERRGGRAKGTPNRASVERQAAIAASGLTPLDYMLAILRDETVEVRAVTRWLKPPLRTCIPGWHRWSRPTSLTPSCSRP